MTRPLKLAPAAVDALMAFHWPGNVRQLERALERAVALAGGPAIGVADLPEEVSAPYRKVFAASADPDETLRAWSSRYVRQVLERCHGNKRRACQILDVSFHTLQAHLDHAAAEAEPPDRARTPLASSG